VTSEPVAEILVAAPAFALAVVVLASARTLSRGAGFLLLTLALVSALLMTLRHHGLLPW
jgi:hypothetical protein